MKSQNCILINSVTDARTDARTYTHTDKLKTICPFNFSKVGGITSPQIMSIFGGTHICMCIFKNKANCPQMYYIVKWCNLKLSTKHPSETKNNFENSN